MSDTEVPGVPLGMKPPPSRNEMAVGAGVDTVLQIGRDLNLRVVEPSPLERPCQSPLPNRGFRDREEVQECIVAELPASDEAERIGVVVGPPGVGKRAVVRKVADSCGDRFPAGVLYVDCADFVAQSGAGRDAVLAMLVDVLSNLGIAPKHAPRSLSGLRTCYQAKLARRPGPVLVVIENATDPEQVTALLPNKPGSFVLVAAASGADLRALELHDARFHRLGGLEHPYNMELFRAAAGTALDTSAESVQAELVRLCDGIPLALLVVAKRVARLRGMTDAELARELSDDRRILAALALGGQQIVSAALMAAYRTLPARLRFAYRTLSLLPGSDIGPDVAAVALSADAAAAREVLEALADAQFLEHKSSGRYAFSNNLIRVYGREQAEDENAEGESAERREAVLEKVLRHYLVRLAFFDRAKREDRTRVADHGELLAGQADPFAGPDPAETAIAWLDGERVNLMAVVQAAYDADLFRVAILLADALTAYFPDRRDLSAWIATSTLGVRAARRLGDTWAEARLRSVMSRPLTDREDFEEARAQLQMSQRLAEQIGDPVLQASVWEFEGRFLVLFDPLAALAAYQRCRELNAQAGERRGAALALSFTAEALCEMAEYERARSSYERALQEFAELDDPRMIARAHIGLGAVNIKLGDMRAAAGSLLIAVSELAGTYYEAQARTHLAEIARETGDAAAMRGHLKRALKIYQDVKHPRADALADQLNTDTSIQPVDAEEDDHG